MKAGLRPLLVLAALVLQPVQAQTNSTPDRLSLPTGPAATNLSFRSLDLRLSPEQQAERDSILRSQVERAAADQLAAGNPARAVAAYRALDPELLRKPANRCGLALALMQHGEETEAEQLLRQLTVEQPDEPVHWNNLAWLRATARDIRLRDADEAIRAARRALALVPRDPRVWHTLSEAYFLDQQYEEAARRARQAIELAKEPPFADMALPDFAAQLDKAERAAGLLPALRESP